ncbi:hypothetical protein ACSBR1_019126 [Camellia fascicularis]
MCSEREENFGKPIRDQLFNDARVPWSEYHYYDPKTVGFDFDGMISDIKVCYCCERMGCYAMLLFLLCFVFQCCFRFCCFGSGSILLLQSVSLLQFLLWSISSFILLVCSTQLWTAMC